MKIFAIPALLLILPFCVNGQKTTYLTLEAGPQWSLLKVVDPGGYFEPVSGKSSIAGITLGQEIFRDFSLVTGVYYLPYKSSIDMIDERTWTPEWTAFNSLLIPIRAEYRLQFTEFPVSLTPRIGYMYNRVSFPGSPFGRSGILAAPGGEVFSMDLDQQFSDPSAHLLEIGAAVGLRFAGLWQASLNISYLNGFKGNDEPAILLTYQDPPGNPVTAEYHARGNQLYTTLSMHIPVSNIWQNRDYRIRSRVENSTMAGKPTETYRKFYLGAETGILWRQFHTTNAAVGARPMEDRGFLRYANFHGGLYAGWMLKDDLGLDLGVNYQRSSMFYTISHDHETDLAFRTSAPLFLEVPLRIRYFYNLHSEKIYFVVYGGASLLTHFSAGEYSTGDGAFSYVSPATGDVTEATTSYEARRISSFRPLMRFGTGAEYRLPMEFPLIATLYLNYMHGFMAAEAISVSGSTPGGATFSELSYRGSGWSLDVGVKVPLPFKRDGACAPPPEREE